MSKASPRKRDTSVRCLSLVAVACLVGCSSREAQHSQPIEDAVPNTSGAFLLDAGQVSDEQQSSASVVSAATSSETGSDILATVETSEGSEVASLDTTSLDTTSFDATSSTGEAISPEEPPESFVCGDGVRDTLDEECDSGRTGGGDVCTLTCRVITQQLRVTQGQADNIERELGGGRHTIGASPSGFSIAYVEYAEEDEASGSESEPTTRAQLGISFFDVMGNRLLSRAVDGANASALSAPVVAATLDDAYAVAWTDYLGDGDELGIGLTTFTPTGTPAPPGATSFPPPAQGSVQFANQESAFSQHSPDVAWLGDQLLLAWIDESYLTPQVVARYFTAAGLPNGDEFPLSTSDNIQSRVSLTRFGAGWAAAWLESSLNGAAAITVATSGDANWQVNLAAPGGEADVPALIAIDAQHLLLAYTEGTDPDDSGLFAVPRLRVAILSLNQQGSVIGSSINHVVEPFLSAERVSQWHPDLLTVEEQVYVAWTTSGLPGDATGDEVWLKQLTYDASTMATWSLSGSLSGLFKLTLEEQPIPRVFGTRTGDQSTPALGVVLSPYLQGGAIAAAWNDVGVAQAEPVPSTGPTPRPDVAFTLIPNPIVLLEAGIACGDVTGGCKAGEGHCTSDAQCSAGLRCTTGVSRRFGYIDGHNVCLLPSCSNGVKDGTETAKDCGGVCGPCVTCPTGSAGGDHYCSAVCPCAERKGDCDTDAECLSSLRCGVNNAGTIPGMAPNREVCVVPHCRNYKVDSDEQGVDCGGAQCLPCNAPTP